MTKNKEILSSNMYIFTDGLLFKKLTEELMMPTIANHKQQLPHKNTSCTLTAAPGREGTTSRFRTVMYQIATQILQES